VAAEELVMALVRALVPAGRNRPVLFATLMVLPAVGAMLIIGGYPVVSGIAASFTNQQLTATPYHYTGISNYTQLFESSTFHQVIINTLIWSFGGTVLALLIAASLALLLAAKNRHNGLFQLLWLLPWAMPQISLAIVFNWLYLPLVGFLPNWAAHFHVSFPALLASPHLALWAVLLPAVWTTYPFSMLFIQAALLGIDESLIEAAALDGASGWQRFRHVKLPVIGAVVRVAALLDFVWLFNQFAVVWVMTEGGPLDRTQLLGSYAYKEAFMVQNIGVGTAIGVVMLLMLIIFVVTFAHLLRRTYGGLGV
jgi:ABC-type sugar transport system permease subunit